MQDQTQPIDLLGVNTQDAARSDPGSIGSQGVDPDFGSWLSPALLLLGVSLATWMMVRMLIRRRKRLLIPTGTPHDRLDAIRVQAKKREQLHAFGADVHELVQRLATQLDNKAARMEQLLRDADERIRKLERMQRIASDLPSVASEHQSDHLSEDKPDPVTNRVYELADQGEKPIEIARQLNQHVGQVELILALRRA